MQRWRNSGIFGEDAIESTHAKINRLKRRAFGIRNRLDRKKFLVRTHDDSQHDHTASHSTSQHDPQTRHNQMTNEVPVPHQTDGMDAPAAPSPSYSGH